MLLDTSVLLELARRLPDDPLVTRVKALVGDKAMFASPIHLGEIADAARRMRLSPESTVTSVLQFIELIPLDAGIALQASALKAEARKRTSGRDFSLIDGVGLASARSRGLAMLTMDHEFDGFQDVTVLER